MKPTLFITLFSLLGASAFSQNIPDPKFPLADLREDFVFVKKQITEVHANPYTEVDSLRYQDLFRQAESALTDSMTAFEFARVVRPLFAPLSDEHANIGVDISRTSLNTARVFIPFSIRKAGDFIVIDSVLLPGLALRPGDTLTAIENVAIGQILGRCAHFTTGFPDQRAAKAVRLFGITYLYAYPLKTEYTVQTNRKTVRVSGTDYPAWQNFLAGKAAKPCDSVISYTRFGAVGYIDFCSFSIRSDSAFDALDAKIQNIFQQVRKDRIRTLLIDVSNNSGGNSGCGDLIIQYFRKKPYRGYQAKWKRSDAYLQLMKSWGSAYPPYENAPAGSILTLGPGTYTPPRRLKNRFKGKVYVLVGQNTFSSAIMFATIVKDNRLALLAGESPGDGHPNHFGEMYGATTPRTRLSLRFGVKQWLRPDATQTENRLIPDIEVVLPKDKAELVRAVVQQAPDGKNPF